MPKRNSPSAALRTGPAVSLGAAMLLAWGPAPAGAAVFDTGTPAQQPPPVQADRVPFLGETPLGWHPVEEVAAWGHSTHYVGPSEADGAYRPAIHVHFMQQGRPGFIPLEEAVRRARAADKATGREATALRRTRVARTAARRFEVTETRQLAPGLLPSRPAVLHHFYAVLPWADGYFILKLSSLRETYLGHKDDFEKLLNTFQPGAQ